MDMNRGKQSEQNGAKTLMRAVCMAGKGWQQAKHSLQNQATAGGHSRRTLRTAQASNKRPQMAGLAAKTTAADQRRPASRRAVQVGGGSAKMLALRKAGSDLPKPVPTPPNAFACHCPYPLP